MSQQEIWWACLSSQDLVGRVRRIGSSRPAVATRQDAILKGTKKKNTLSPGDCHSNTLYFLYFLSAEDQSQGLPHARQALNTETNISSMVLDLILKLFLEMLPLALEEGANQLHPPRPQASHGSGVTNSVHSGLAVPDSFSTRSLRGHILHPKMDKL